MKIRQEGAELYHEDGWIDKQTDRNDHLILTPRNCAPVSIKDINIP